MDRIIIDYANILVDIKKIFQTADGSWLSSGGDVYSSFPTLLLCLVSPVTVSLPFLFPSPAPAQPSPAQLSSHSLESLHLHPSTLELEIKFSQL